MTTIASNALPQNVLDSMNPAKPKAGSTAAEAQDRFMTLLVTQMKNQDPLNPLDNAQVTSQLAQLSTVTGIDKLNATVEALMGSYQSSQTLNAANMIGHGVFVPGSDLVLEDGKAIFGIDLSEGVDKVQLKIRDSFGQLVHEIEMGPQTTGTVPLTWDGKTASGVDAADGKYSFEVVALRGGEATKAATSLAFGQVASVSTGTAGVKLNIPGLGPVNLADVRQIL